MKYLINLDLEGVNHVTGIPYSGLSRDLEEYKIAVTEAVPEVNTVASALFDLGAEVYFWDNHGGGNNVDTAKLDSGIHVLPKSETDGLRMDFADSYGFDGLFLMGYHSMEGTLGGVLAHTMNSKEYQYIRIGGHDVGEIAIDTYIASSKGIPTRFVSSDDKGCLEAVTFFRHIRTVTTKVGLSRNQAIFRPDDEVFADLYRTAQEAAKLSCGPTPLTFPCLYEIRYTRTERAAEALINLETVFGIKAAYRGDAHTLTFMMQDISDLQKAMNI